jgi:hypothetical protein
MFLNKQKQRKSKADPKAERWAEAKRLCRLSMRQVEMAKALGMNPQKLPGLRPSKSQKWKLPVGQFIEECYAKRFGDQPSSGHSGRLAPADMTRTPRARGSASNRQGESFYPESPSVTPRVSSVTSAHQQDKSGQAADLMVYLKNLADKLEETLADAAVTPELLAALSSDLRAVATRLLNGESIPTMPSVEGFILNRSRRNVECEHVSFDDSDIPF